LAVGAFVGLAVGAAVGVAGAAVTSVAAAAVVSCAGDGIAGAGVRGWLISGTLSCFIVSGTPLYVEVPDELTASGTSENTSDICEVSKI